MMSRTRFKCTALLLCHDVLHDARTGNVHLIGVGNRLRPDRYPARIPGFCVYVVLYGVEDHDTLVLVCCDADDSDIFATPIHRIESPGKNEHRVTFQVLDAVFPQPGRYRLQCIVNEFRISETYIILPPLEEKQP
jgi:hypothetical protein